MRVDGQALRNATNCFYFIFLQDYGLILRFGRILVAWHEQEHHLLHGRIELHDVASDKLDAANPAGVYQNSGDD